MQICKVQEIKDVLLPEIKNDISYFMQNGIKKKSISKIKKSINL